MYGRERKENFGLLQEEQVLGGRTFVGEGSRDRMEKQF